ncbi:MAG: hypothetical protein WC254_00240 [Candidatus Woesearchaeota archaeon]|jgi:hypothetical protein
MPILKPNTVLWIEDTYAYVEPLVDHLEFNETLIKAYGKPLKLVHCPIDREISDSLASSTIDQLVGQVEEDPSFLNVVTAQMGRKYLERYLPGAIICDSNFPLNGTKVIRWLQNHGLSEYPLIGLSADTIEQLQKTRPDAARFFITTNARYLDKGGKDVISNLVAALTFSRYYVERVYSNPA